MTRIRNIAIFIITLCTISGLAAGNAAASGGKGPSWFLWEWNGRCRTAIIGSYETEPACLAGTPITFFGGFEREYVRANLLPKAASRKILGSNLEPENLGAIRLSAQTESVECGMVEDTGELIGGAPGKSSLHLAFSGCKVWKGSTFTTELPNCKVSNPGGTEGQFAVEATGEQIYIGSKAEAESEKGKLGERIAAMKEGKESNLFVELEFTGAECSYAGDVPVKGTVIAEISSGEAVWGSLTLPSTALTTGFRWESEGKFKEARAGLRVHCAPATLSGATTARIESLSEAYEAEP